MKNYVDFDPSSIDWNNALQYGGGDSQRYIGVYDHRGYGLFSSFIRYLVPVLKSVGKAVGRELLTTGAKAAQDMAEGASFKEVAKKRGKEGVHNLFEKAAKETSGAGVKRRKVVKRRGVGVYKF